MACVFANLVSAGVVQLRSLRKEYTAFFKNAGITILHQFESPPSPIMSVLRRTLIVGVCAVALLATVVSAANTLHAMSHHSNDNNYKPPSTIPKLNVTAYLGTWLNVAANLFVLATFQNNSFCATATYGPVNATTGRIQVLNWERQYSAAGNARNITGYATQSHPNSHPGELTVRLFASNASPFPAPYWIFAIGPIVNGQYEWAVVSDPLRLTLFILTRNLGRWKRLYATRVLALVAKEGFTGLDAPIDIVQGPQCNYPKI